MAHERFNREPSLDSNVAHHQHFPEFFRGLLEQIPIDFTHSLRA
jgi:hypothetical protein